MAQTVKDKQSNKDWPQPAWYSWGSPVGLGIFLVALGVFLWLLMNGSVFVD